MTNDFISNLIERSSELATHRQSDYLEAQDINFILGKTLTFETDVQRKYMENAGLSL
jgi:Transcription initiation factor TFIID subunit A.